GDPGVRAAVGVLRLAAGGSVRGGRSGGVSECRGRAPGVGGLRGELRHRPHPPLVGSDVAAGRAADRVSDRARHGGDAALRRHRVARDALFPGGAAGESIVKCFWLGRWSEEWRGRSSWHGTLSRRTPEVTLPLAEQLTAYPIAPAVVTLRSGGIEWRGTRSAL